VFTLLYFKATAARQRDGLLGEGGGLIVAFMFALHAQVRVPPVEAD